MSFLVFKAYVKLIHFEVHLARRDFAGLYEKVRTYHVEQAANDSTTVKQICTAVDIACIWYWKEVQCLQRSAAATCLLKRHGVRARLVIGAQQMPFKAHAWVEVDGNVVNDKPYIHEMYAVLDRV